MGARLSGKVLAAAGPHAAGTGRALVPSRCPALTGPSPSPGPGGLPGKGPGPSARAALPGPHDEDRLSRRKSIVDTVSIQVDILSSTGTDDKVDNTEEITFEALKKAIDNNGLEEQEKEKRRLVIEKFQKAPFEEIAAQCETKANLLHDRLAQILDLTIRPPPSPSGTVTITSGHAHYHSVPVYEMKFPDLCVY